MMQMCKPHDLFCFPQLSGEISYNGHGLNEFVPRKTSAYISQHDLHTAEMTVRETIDFSARCQGVGSRTGRCHHKAMLSLKHSLNYFLEQIYHSLYTNVKKNC